MYLHGEWLDTPTFAGLKTNPSALYMGWAVEHLVTIDKCLQMIDSFSNLNMLDISAAIMAEKRKLIESDINYWEAELLKQKIGYSGGFFN